MPNMLYVLIMAVAGFCFGFTIVSIPGMRNRLKKDDKRFTDKEMDAIIDRREANFASSNEEYSRVHKPLE